MQKNATTHPIEILGGVMLKLARASTFQNTCELVSRANGGPASWSISYPTSCHPYQPTFATVQRLKCMPM